MEALRALALMGYVCVCAAVTGMAALHVLRVPRCVRGVERLGVSAGMGLGLHAYALTLIGLAGWFWPSVVLAVPLTLGVSGLALRPLFDWSWTLRRPAAVEFIAIALLALLAVSVVVSDLAPPSDYDGLLYHLVAPRTYLERGELAYIPDNFSANLPAFGEMLFAVGLAGGSDRAPQLIHAAAGALSVVVTAAIGARLLGRRAGLWSAAALAGTPLVPFLATRAYIDLFTVLFATIAVWCVVVWLGDDDRWPLLLGGGAIGFAIATKYAALTVALPLGLLIAGAGWRRTGFPAGMLEAVAFGGAALLACVPWVVRQLTLLGNPVWPMYLGGRDWGPMRVEQLTYFVSQYGSGASFQDTLLLPINVFRESWRFGHVPWSFPPPLAVAVPLALLDWRPATRWLLAFAALATLLWARGWQDLRFLLSVYPALAVLGVAGLRAALPPRLASAFVAAGTCAMLVVTAAREGQRALARLPVISGAEPVERYLDREISTQAAVAYLNERADRQASVLFLGAGPVWYCRMRCIPDSAHDNLLVWILGGGDAAAPTLTAVDPDATAQRLRSRGVSHVLLSKSDYWYLEHQDPEERLKRQLAEFYIFKARFLDLVYEDDLNEVYRARW